MSVDTPPDPERAPVLRREALLPNERSRGLGTIAVVCTMAGVASGLALATTLMAMQVADSMAVRQCPYHVTMSAPIEFHPDQGFLGITYVFDGGSSKIVKVQPNTPAEAVDLHVGDRVLSIDGFTPHSLSDLTARIAGSPPGTQPTLVIERDGRQQTVHPTLAAWSSLD
jgi:predicted metalloprotease with PDZ domain